MEGRPRSLNTALNEAAIEHEIVPFNIIRVDTNLENSIMTTTFDSQIPTSHHVTVEQIEEMYKKGWNKTVLPEYTYYLGGHKYVLPDVPDPKLWAQYCTCQNAKS